MYHVKLIRRFAQVSFQNQAAYRANLGIGLLYSLLNIGTGILGVMVLFEQIEVIQGWTLASALALLGVYLTLDALRDLFIGPSLESLVGMDGEVWQGTFDFTLLRPVGVQFLASFRYWRPLALLDLALGVGVLMLATMRLSVALTPARLAVFMLSLLAGMVILYSILLAFSALVLWSPGFLFTWLFNAFFQMARYPVGLYPGWLRLVLTWVVPVGVMTTLPAQALASDLPPLLLLGGLGLAALLLAGSTALFQAGLRRYSSASS